MLSLIACLVLLLVAGVATIIVLLAAINDVLNGFVGGNFLLLIGIMFCVSILINFVEKKVTKLKQELKMLRGAKE
jgi:hypothetical protein